MKLDWMLLANYAEVRDELLYISGGGWDTISIGAPIEGAPHGVFAIVPGTLVIRMLFHPTETGRDHSFSVTIMDEDGAEVKKAEGSLRVEKTPGLPPGWDQNVNLAIPLGPAVQLPGPGLYTISLLVNGQHVGDRPFRVLKGY
jgi:hypothetical protein